MSELDAIDRWRLILGAASSDALPASSAVMPYDAALEWLYGREGELARRGIAPADRHGGNGPTALSVPEWLDAVHTLFPKETIERLEHDAVERYGIEEIVTDPEVLARVEPSRALLRAVLRTKHLMNAELLGLARKLVHEVVRRLREALRTEVERAFSGTLDRRRSSPLRIARNLDLTRTLKQNLRHYDPVRGRVVLQRPYFHARVRAHSERWQLVLLVDQSASMLDSTIHAAVTASCFWSVRGLHTHLITFDTEVVDLTHEVDDPVELLMKVQLGGGTDIARAMAYAASQIERPRRAIVVLITDFYEGGNRVELLRSIRSMVADGVRVIGLASLDAEANASFDRDLASQCAAAGATVGAMTPGELATFVAEAIGR